MRPSIKGSEKDFVAREAADAKSALLASLDNLKTSAVESLDVRRWAERYPLRTAGVAVIAGFVAIVTGRRPSPAEPVNDEPPAISSKPAAPTEASTAGETSTRSAITALIITALVDVLKTAAQNFFMNAIRPPQEAASVDADQQGERQN
jgi:hypothetical protein